MIPLSTRLIIILHLYIVLMPRCCKDPRQFVKKITCVVRCGNFFTKWRIHMRLPDKDRFFFHELTWTTRALRATSYSSARLIVLHYIDMRAHSPLLGVGTGVGLVTIFVHKTCSIANNLFNFRKGGCTKAIKGIGNEGRGLKDSLLT